MMENKTDNNKIPQTDDLVYDMSWFIEWAAYSISGDNPRRKGFERKLRDYLKSRELYIARERDL